VLPEAVFLPSLRALTAPKLSSRPQSRPRRKAGGIRRLFPAGDLKRSGYTMKSPLRFLSVDFSGWQSDFAQVKQLDLKAMFARSARTISRFSVIRKSS